MVSMYQGNNCGTPCSVILGNLLKGAHRIPLRDYCNYIELNNMLIELIERLILLINRLIVLFNRLIQLFDMLGEFITALFINGLIKLINRLVMNSFWLWLFYDFAIYILNVSCVIILKTFALFSVLVILVETID